MTTVFDVLASHGIVGDDATTMLRAVFTAMMDDRFESKRDALGLGPFYGDFRDLAVQLSHARLEVGSTVYQQCVTDLFGSDGVRFAMLAPQIAEVAR
ncbi:hypothetical protein [Corynebacterium liangguodongii]|uniref:Uncharacterized protein n=1 Tax=Corynebacterium liangguodongii TaxID=2079535 RepID=A0A2S0WG79_9CORY|nr:hypothetical protein [Corynebacterium liangguodongii]AWB84777.1 hypothetical protein C3E79_10085 [Corynebacterium liangguodongii]PWB99135.1 hypothetical protein DF219_07700 [Corynebacterium liangguodongii]